MAWRLIRAYFPLHSILFLILLFSPLFIFLYFLLLLLSLLLLWATAAIAYGQQINIDYYESLLFFSSFSILVASMLLLLTLMGNISAKKQKNNLV